ncbi:ATP-dependent DNA helicase MCM (intein-containing) [Natronomonas pharaonis DSM 2160]|uniref:DNA helicase n=1 Tax=Natronomonas pharaonis (strain ATCC 35678 / DSM 2160 / CIP 103997 / JCM 8858 / NBRC 14720 / NCIMB 2260 / Gabara) TaxID=348780 RepID=A0A1U7EZB2_NATPD|nr:ATP-binding protein [Natronomonas pharaonis]CAI50644.1 ATP-dependent DNA helicase MCM (intein-containing) [Natronomonas pharaonis DSM 2160]
MARAEDTEIIDKFEQFYRDYYRDEIGQLAQKYPEDQRSLYIDWDDLYRFDADLADDLVAQPDQIRDYAEEALRLYDLPVDVQLGRAHVRVHNLQQTTGIRDIRARHRGNLVEVTGIVRKATDVRPKITEAAFECQRCGTLTRIPQTAGDFHDPHECQGCERQGPFDINFDQSEFVDAQKIRVQESPEGLRGGETPQSIDVHIEDDITGKVTAGDHVRVAGVLHLDQQGSEQEKSPVFDVYMDGMSVEIEDEQFEDMDITDEDKQRIIELSNDDGIYQQMVESMAPSIYGYEQQKLAIIMQLFSGVTKDLPDGSRIRGDLHMLLIGDPGTGKCVDGDTSVTLASGDEKPIRDIVESTLEDPTEISDGFYQESDIDVLTTDGGAVAPGRATKVWKRQAPEKMYRIRTESGRELEVTPSHPLFVQSEGGLSPLVADDLSENDFVAVPRALPADDGDDFGQHVDDLGSVTARKTADAEAVRSEDAATTPDVIPNVGDQLRRIRTSLRLSQHDCGLPRSTYQQYERGDRNPSRSRLQTVLTAFERRIEQLSSLSDRVDDGDSDAIAAARDELNPSQASLASGMDATRTAIGDDERTEARPDGGAVADAERAVADALCRALAVADDVERLRSLADGDIGWDRIDSIEPVEPEDEWVYDLEVESTHSYLSNDVVSHNSQLLQYVKNIAPRSVYTSGKGSSSAGLTAAAVRDDFGEGQQWTLEAGALVLADQGIAAVDELDKMRSEDQSAMHQALEQQEISVSKAGINATLKSRCSLLAAANPIHGRFDEYEPFAEQIDLDPPLISRFDLIFTVTDQPDEEEDRQLAEHIIETNYAGELQTHRTKAATSNVSQEQVDSVTEDVAPAIDDELLRKYVAYAKRNCYPTMTEEAKEAIQEFYVDLRLEGQSEDNPVPITARKLEALVRLAEASARIRLSDTATKDDAERVIEIVRSSLEDVGVDPETGELDADIIESGTSKTQRDRIKNIKSLISEVETEYDEGAPIDVVLDRAEEMGMDRSQAEHEIEKLRRQGDVYEPQTDHLRTV